MCVCARSLSGSETTLSSWLFLSLHQQTPLHIAASKNYEHTVKCLVDEGADINIKDNTGVGIHVILYTTVGAVFL